MKGKSSFTPDEIDELKQLIEEKQKASSANQKTIRNKIRKIGFYASDFNLGDGYSFEDFSSVITEKKIFTWVPTHKTINNFLLQNESNQSGLVELLRRVGVDSLNDRPSPESIEDLNEIDPFSFYCFIYKHGPANRLSVLRKISVEMRIEPLPEDERGLPSSNALSSRLFPVKYERIDEIDRLWSLFKKAISNEIEDSDFEDALKIENIAETKITEILFYVAPDRYLPINGPTKPYLKEVLGIDPTFKSFGDYLSILTKVKEKSNLPFYEISYEAWRWNEKHKNSGSDLKKIEKQFKKYLEKVVPNSVRNYLSGISKINEVGIDLGLIEESIYEIQTPDVLAHLVNEFGKSDEWNKRNKVGKGMFRGTLNHYQNFVLSLTAPEIVKDKKWYELARLLKKINDESAIRKFFNTVRFLSDHFGLTDSNPNVYSSCLNNQIQLTLGSRYVVRVKKEKGFLSLGYYIKDQFLEELRRKYPSMEESKGPSDITWVTLPANDTEESDFHAAVIAVSEIAIKEQSRSQYRTTYADKHNPWVLKVATDPILLEMILQEENLDPSDLSPSSKNTLPMNTILYGPPGTGKTYATIANAVAIIEGLSLKELEEEYDTRKDLKEKYLEYLKDGKILFTTFHQSTTYEDFVEGIKPKSDGDSDAISYPVEDGIFKKLCAEADKANVSSSNFDKLYKQFIESLHPTKATVFETVQQAREFSAYRNSKDNIKFHANTEKAYEAVIKKEVLEHYLLTGETLDWPSYVKALGKYFREELGYVAEKKENDAANYVLIIDEINRGNVASIFGELITLIEKDKRKGQPEEISVQLPYSKSYFSVPSNLFILGTMNTADRSVEALDSALRRRFSFKEVKPDPDLLEPYFMLWRLWQKHEDSKWKDKKWLAQEGALLKLLEGKKINEKEYKNLENIDDWSTGMEENVFEGIVEFKGVNCADLLRTINERIELLLDKDHTIGHSYFFSLIGSEDCVLELLSIFYDKIIPLLEEYFYGDYGKIGLILGQHFVENISSTNASVFADFVYEDRDILIDKARYTIKDYRDEDLRSDFIAAVKSVYSN